MDDVGDDKMNQLDREMEIWARYVYEDKLDPSVQPAVADSWKKCKAAGVNPNGGLGKRVNDEVFASIRTENITLIDTALPIMQSVFEIVKKTNFVMVLTDSVGYILETIGAEDLKDRIEDLRFVPGALWNNLDVGTNAISVALDYDTAIQMVGPEHYCRSHHSWTCSAAPIHGINGEVIGCLDMSGDAGSAHDHTLGLVLAAVYGIEGKLSILHSAELMRSALEASADAIILLNQAFCPIWMNSAATDLLGMELTALQDRDFREILPDIHWSALDKGERFFADDSRVRTSNGIRRCSAAITPSMDYGAETINVTLKKQKHLINSANKVNGNRAVYTFDDIYTRDPQMKKTLALAQKYAKYDGNILIQGESGTGKELIAQAIHNAGSRASGPFVAINCASIPRDFLESELFGYEAGALGASAEGNPGRFELAEHGTLFLDEITSLPLEFQSKLLRAVETHSIVRLGSGQELNLDIRIIASTNQKLEQAVSSGSLRQDLFYRLDVLRLEIPPLRERPGDIAYCAERFIERFNARSSETAKSMAPQFIEGLMKYDWPGNVRQLQNSIERAFYSSTEPVLTENSLRFAIHCAEPGPSHDYQRESGEILAALTVCGGDVEDAAEKLGVSRATLYRRLKKFGIDPKTVVHK